MLEYQKDIKDGMLLLVSKNRDYIDATHKILKHIHQLYINKNSHFYTEQNELDWINHFLDSVIYKSFLTSIAVEQLQSIRHGKIQEALWPAIENNIAILDCSNNERILVSFALESFLFEARSFLDVYMIFICLLLRTGFRSGHMNTSRFFDELDKVTEPPFKQKAVWTRDYFNSKVFGQKDENKAVIIRDDWGTLLINLRDKIAHRDSLLQSFDSREKFINDILLNWPTLNQITYHLLTETMRNGMYGLFHQALCNIYELKWDDYQKTI